MSALGYACFRAVTLHKDILGNHKVRAVEMKCCAEGLSGFKSKE